jgi:signal transduction histidine kinase
MTITGRFWDRRPTRLATLDQVRLRRLVDLVSAGFAMALFLRLADPEILLQGLWLTVAIGAFVYGLTAALWRIGIATAVIIGYVAVSDVVGVPPTEEQLDVGEWPLMVSIAVIVAILAERVATSARHYASMYRQASERLVTAHEEERASLARELHDGVGQTLTAVILTLDAADAELQSARAQSTDGASGDVHRARELAAAALAETRTVAAKLRPTRVHEIGLGAALESLAHAAGIPVEVRFDPVLMPPGLLEPELEIDVYRIVQEALGNAARHSKATRVWISADVVNGMIKLVVGDDGIGFDDSTRAEGLGLDGMYERAGIHGLDIAISSKRGEGTRVEIAVPIARRPAPASIRMGPAVHLGH